MESSAWTKDEIRRAMREKRRAVSPKMRAAVSHDICEKLRTHPEVRAAIRNRAVIAVYIATPREIDLAEFIKAVHDQGGRLAAPRWNGCEYEMVEFTPDSLVLNPQSPTPNIPEPPPPKPISHSHSHSHSLFPIPYPLSPNPSLWIVPGLAFTREGARLGEGGGWYDRMLGSPHLQPPTSHLQPSLLGIAYDFQILPDLPIEPHDCKLTCVIVGDHCPVGA